MSRRLPTYLTLTESLFLLRYGIFYFSIQSLIFFILAFKADFTSSTCGYSANRIALKIRGHSGCGLWDNWTRPDTTKGVVCKAKKAQDTVILLHGTR